jgi:uncharacterized NAD(P)/FAD-binding protein YdhS
MVAVHLLERATSPLDISLIERRPAIGQGLAYSTTLGTHVLNVPAARMGAKADRVDDFQRWLKELEPEFGEFAAHGFVPRIWYGTYLQALLAQAEVLAAPGVELRRVSGSVVSVESDSPEAGGSYLVRLASGQGIAAEAVVLALGNLPAGDPPLERGSLAGLNEGGGDLYLPDGWDTEAVRAIPAEADILLIGTGLTMVDWAFSLGRQGHRGTIHAVSRRGLVPRSHGPAEAVELSEAIAAAPPTALGLSRAVRAEVVRTTAAGGDWRAVVDALRPRTQALWAALPIAERRRFVRHLRPYWDVHRHRAAPHVAALIEEMRRSGRLVVHAGRLVSASTPSGAPAGDRAGRESGRGAEVTLRERRTGSALVLSVARIVNTIGPGGDIRSSGEALIDGLLADGLAQADPLGLGLRTADDGALLDRAGHPSTSMFTLGSTRRGDLWESTAVPELRVQAARLAERLLQERPESRATLAAHGGDREE